jgi:hypothetical protein
LDLQYCGFQIGIYLKISKASFRKYITIYKIPLTPFKKGGTTDEQFPLEKGEQQMNNPLKKEGTKDEHLTRHKVGYIDCRKGINFFFSIQKEVEYEAFNH